MGNREGGILAFIKGEKKEYNSRNRISKSIKAGIYLKHIYKIM